MAQVSVLTNHNDNGRTGQNLQETTLTTSNVNVSNFGKLFTRAVDGYIYAQPLYVPGLTIGGKTRNVVYVATEHNSVYAFDADDPAASAPLWHVTPTTLGTSVPSGDVCAGLSIAECPYKDLLPEIGITGTPVIDPASSTIYVVAKSKNTSNSTYHFKLHALDLITGAEKFGGPVEITATVSGTGSGSSGGTITFKPLTQMNRPGLLLLNGVVYVGFGSVGDVPPWHGWIFGYSAANLLTTPTVFIATPNGDSGGFWSAGQGLAGNSGGIYGATSNGLFDVNTGGKDYGDSILKLNASSTSIGVADYFTPHDQSFLDTGNVDLGSGGPMLLPNTTDLVNIGKDGYLRLIDTTTGKMGGFNATTDQNLQNLLVTNGTNSFAFMGSPIYWNSPNNGPVIYFWGPDDFLKAYKFVNGLFQTTPVSQGNIQGTAGYSNSMPLSLSANGTQNGIVWATAPLGDASEQTVTGIVRAFDATDLGNELWDSNQNPGRDALGNYAKFTPPTIANGKVYVPTFSDALVVYGLNPPPVSSITFMQVAAATPQSNSATVPVAYPQAEVAGDLNVVVVGWNDTTSSVSSVIDKLGNAYTLVVGPTPASGGQQSIYYAKNIKGGSNTVTVNFNQAAVYPDVRVLEYAGADTTSPIDAVLKGCVGSSTTASCGPITTNAANDLVFAADTIATGTPGPGAGFTARIITPHDSDLAEDEIAPNPGSYTATAPLSPSGYWVMQVVAFKVQGSTSSPAPTVSSVSPTSGSTIGGTAVTVAGTNFSAGATVTFGGTAASNVNVVSGTSITATTPAHAAGAVTAAVTNTDGQSGTLPNGFTYVSPTPTVSSISPNSGSTNGGTSVAITGTNFAAGATVTFGGTAATNVTIASSTQITAITPAHAAGAVNVVVTNTGGPSGTLANGFTYSSSTSKQITFVQVNNPNTVPPQGSVPSVSVSYPVAQTAGNLNIVVVGWNDTTSTVSSVVDSLGNTYSLAAAPAHASGATQSIYYAKNIKAGSNTVTVNFSQAAAYPDIRVLEYSGASTTSPIDRVISAVGSSTTASCGPVTTTAANELIFAADTIATGTPGPGSGFTTRIITSHDSDLAEDKQAATAGSYSATAPVSPSGYWVIQMVTIKQ